MNNNESIFKLYGSDLRMGNLTHEIATAESDELTFVNNFFASITCNNKEIEKLLYEMIGYACTRETKFAVAFILKGQGRNGKSKIARIIEHLLVDSKCSHEHLENICGTKPGGKTTVENLEHSCCNLLEDQKNIKYVNTSLLTRIISGEPIAVKDRDIKPYCKMIFTVNEVINFHENGLHIKDRFIVIPFNAIFTDDNNNRDINIEEKLCQDKVLQIIAVKALEAYNEVVKIGKFSVPQIVIDETNKYFLDCNNVAQFDKEYPIESKVIKYNHYSQYKDWCESNNLETVSNTVFGKEILALGYKTGRYTIDNVRKTYYVNPNYDFSKDIDLNPANTTSEETSNQVADEQDILSEATMALNNKLPEDISITMPENWQEAEDLLLGL